MKKHKKNKNINGEVTAENQADLSAAENPTGAGEVTEDNGSTPQTGEVTEDKGSTPQTGGTFEERAEEATGEESVKEIKKGRRRKLKKRIIALIVCGAFVVSLGIAVLGFQIAFMVTDATARCWRPDYAALPENELKELYLKPDKTDDDYQTLFAQTGLTKIGIDRALKRGESGWQRVREIQREYFAKHEVENGFYCPFICTDHITDYSREIFLEQGDILLTSSTHLSSFRIGHSGIVHNPDSYRSVFQATTIGSENGDAPISVGFTNRIDFMIVRIKPEVYSSDGSSNENDPAYKKALADVVEYITTELSDVPYSPLTGIFTAKDSVKTTMCSHLIWYGFMHFDDLLGENDSAKTGYTRYGTRNLDLDPNGGLLVMPKDISVSPYVELVQSFGFDPAVMYP